MDQLKDTLAKLAFDQRSEWKAKALFRRKNRLWLKKAAEIAQVVLVALKSQSISQQELAVRMGVSPQQISNIVMGQKNLTLDTILKLETALSLKIVKGRT